MESQQFEGKWGVSDYIIWNVKNSFRIIQSEVYQHTDRQGLFWLTHAFDALNWF